MFARQLAVRDFDDILTRTVGGEKEQQRARHSTQIKGSWAIVKLLYFLNHACKDFMFVWFLVQFKVDFLKKCIKIV